MNLEKLSTLTIFHSLYEDKIFHNWISLLKQKEISVEAYCAFVAKLYEKDVNLSHYIYHLVMNTENVYIHKKANQENIPAFLEDALHHELKVLQEISQITSSNLQVRIKYDGFLPSWLTSEYDFVQAYEARIANLSKQGFGMFAKYHTFCIQDGQLTPVYHPDPQQLSELTGYEFGT